MTDTPRHVTAEVADVAAAVERATSDLAIAATRADRSVFPPRAVASWASNRRTGG